MTMGFYGFPDIDKMKADRDVKGLIKALGFEKKNSNHMFVRTGAAQALGELAETRALKPLIAMLKDRQDYVINAAAQALGGIGDARAVKPLNAVLKTKLSPNQNNLRRTVVEALGKAGNARAVEPLMNVLKDSDEGVRRRAAEALGKIGARLEDGELRLRAVEALIALLKDGDKEVRERAVEALGKIGDDRAVEPLIAALTDGDKVVRKDAAEALDRAGWKPVSDEHKVWYWIARQDWDQCAALGEPAVQLLVTAIQEWTGNVRKGAAEALGRMGWKPVSDRHKACYWIARREWLQCVALGEPAVEPLIAALKYENQLEDLEVRPMAARALGRIEDARAVEPLIAALKCGQTYPEREAAAMALGWLKDARAVEPLIAAFEDDHGGNLLVRVEAARALARIGDARAMAPLRAALGDKDGNVRKEAAAALEKLEKSVENRVDLRSAQELQIESTAKAGESLGAEIDRMVAELIQIGRTDGFRSTTTGGKFDKSGNHMRVREIGEVLNGRGGMQLMQAAYYTVRAALPGEARSLEGAWGYIGEWRP
jgi:HEAT repeat protein